jgi:hypothetical protein
VSSISAVKTIMYSKSEIFSTDVDHVTGSIIWAKVDVEMSKMK